MQFGMILLALVIACSVAGSLIVQQREPMEYVTRYGEYAAKLIMALQLDDVFSSVYFLVLMPALRSAWFALHIGSATFSYASFAISGGLGKHMVRHHCRDLRAVHLCRRKQTPAGSALLCRIIFLIHNT